MLGGFALFISSLICFTAAATAQGTTAKTLATAKETTCARSVEKDAIVRVHDLCPVFWFVSLRALVTCMRMAVMRKQLGQAASFERPQQRQLPGHEERLTTNEVCGESVCFDRQLTSINPTTSAENTLPVTSANTSCTHATATATQLKTITCTRRAPA